MNRILPLILMCSVPLLSPHEAIACHDGSPLVLDLNGDDILTTGLFDPVWFDLNADGIAEQTSWTNPNSEEGFLWLDLNNNGSVDDGSELFGDATRLPSGGLAQNGFEALAAYDVLDMGGDEDGFITRRDVVWPYLRVWVDRNHDGVSQRREIRPLGAFRITALEYAYEESDFIDGNVNRHRFIGVYWARVKQSGSRPSLATLPIHDIYFRIVHSD